MCVKFPLRDLNSDPYLPHSTNTYTCGVTIAPMVCVFNFVCFYKLFSWRFEKLFLKKILSVFSPQNFF